MSEPKKEGPGEETRRLRETIAVENIELETLQRAQKARRKDLIARIMYDDLIGGTETDPKKLEKIADEAVTSLLKNLDDFPKGALENPTEADLLKAAKMMDAARAEARKKVGKV